jgi:hypothetical protein
LVGPFGLDHLPRIGAHVQVPKGLLPFGPGREKLMSLIMANHHRA